MSKKISKSQFEDRPIMIGELELPCAVLEDGRRVLSYRGVCRALGLSESWTVGAHKLPPFLSRKSIKSLITEELSAPFSEPLEYNPKHGGRTAYGVEATMLPKICEVWLDAKEAGALKSEKDLLTAEKAKLLHRGFAHVGIIALVDEATGYQDERVKDALNKILNEFLVEEAKRYKVTFPTDFYKIIFKLNSWTWTAQSAQRKPMVVAKWTNDLVYERLAPGLLDELKARNPSKEGKRKHKHFQFLSDEVGEPRLIEHFGGLIALGRVATNWRKYKEMVERAYPKSGDNLMLDLDFNDKK